MRVFLIQYFTTLLKCSINTQNTLTYMQSYNCQCANILKRQFTYSYNKASVPVSSTVTVKSTSTGFASKLTRNESTPSMELGNKQWYGDVYEMRLGYLVHILCTHIQGSLQPATLLRMKSDRQGQDTCPGEIAIHRVWFCTVKWCLTSCLLHTTTHIMNRWERLNSIDTKVSDFTIYLNNKFYGTDFIER